MEGILWGKERSKRQERAKELGWGQGKERSEGKGDKGVNGIEGTKD